MKELYTRPLRVYIVLGALGILGILSGLNLPISLFPNSSQVIISANIPTGSLSDQQFFEIYGNDLEANLQGLKIDDVPVKELKASYQSDYTNYQVKFDWGANPEKAISEVQKVINTRFSNTTDEIRRGIHVNLWSENRGFFAVSFYSPMRSLDDLYQTITPFISPLQSQIEDAGEFGLWNPNQKEITISLIPEKLAQFEINTIQIQQSIQSSLVSLNGGTLKVGEKDYLINIPKNVENIEQLSQIRVSSPGKPIIYLKDVAKISSGVSKDSRRKFKTSGVESLILFAGPKEGGNIKRMADQILFHLNLLKKKWPKDVEFKILVNPSEFINNSVQSVVHEVFIAAFLAVIVLFVFLGSFKNVITAAIEIPLSLLMAFILMRLFGMNLNLISLGGLALSAGMNVDASVVVLENIVRHFELKMGEMTYKDKVQVVVDAVNEVKLPIIASTIASLVVFFPLIFTRGLTNSLLGDLAKAVIFSHGLSAIVALVLVPTIRLQLLKSGEILESHSPIENIFVKLESFYKKTLTAFIANYNLQKIVFSSIIISLPLLIYLVVPKLDKEIIGKPDSDWLIIGFSSPSVTDIKEMESELDSMEEKINLEFNSEKLYTFTQIHGSQSGEIMIRVKDKSKIKKLIEKSEEIFKNTATKFYWVDSWNPSELTIPDPPQFQIEIAGGDVKKRLSIAQDFKDILQSNGVFEKVRVSPSPEKEKEISVKSFTNLSMNSEVVSKEEISHYLRVATQGVYADRIFQNQQELPIFLRFDSTNIDSLDQLKALPFGFEGKLIPLSALADLSIKDRDPENYRINQKSLFLLSGRLNQNQMNMANDKKALAHKFLENYKSKLIINDSKEPSITELIPDIELQESLDQLKWAVCISITLVFLTMVLQLGDIINSLLVLVAIPLGIIGVILSLFVFQSSLSLNSGLGTILLNGIAVANSIILVDFIKKLHTSGLSAKDATINASMARIRPILMTSLTTVLGMLPIAMGLGEGGKILQPLGIAVCGGLWISMLLTLYIVPALQYLYLSKKELKK